MTEREMVQQASALGHRVGIYPRESGRWAWYCSCGKATAGRMTSALALEACLHHASTVVRERRADGVSLPQPVGESL